jgi:inner membrane protein involved in colicin E2 resistance
MEVKAVSPEEMVEELKQAVEQRQRDKYSFQVKLDDVEFAFDKEAASALELDSEMSRIEQAERYLREGVLRPIGFAESDGTRHQVLEWDPTPVAYSGFMGCVTHSTVVTDQGTFEVGRYAAMNLKTFSKVWQWFIHRKIEGAERD